MTIPPLNKSKIPHPTNHRKVQIKEKEMKVHAKRCNQTYAKIGR